MFVVFDLDGTLADDTHRQHFLEQTPKDWDGYFSACGDDTPIWPVRGLWSMINACGHRVEIWTGRSDKYLHETEEWLQYHLYPAEAWGIKRWTIRMRPDGDFRPDTEVKGEWLAECGPPPDLVFDDRTKSVAWWREQGITCLQVAQHDY